MSDSELPNILCVDDEDSILKALTRVLRKKFNLHCFSRGSEALKAFIESPSKFSVVITDLKMPELDGLALLREMKRIDPDCVAIVLSGFGDFEATLEAINQQLVFKYFQKPWNDTLLEQAILEGVQKKNEILIRDQFQKKLSETFDILGSSRPLTADDLKKIRRMAETGAMSSKILHDLNNQIMVLSMAMELLESHKEGTAVGTSLFPTMRHSLASISLMIEDLQAYVASKHSYLSLQSVSLNELFNKSRHPMAMYFIGKSVNIIFDFEKDFTITADPSKIERVLINLAKNASEAMDEGEYRITTSREGDMVKITFKDTGEGMTEEVKNSLFNVYSSSKQKGTGVGLINVKEIIEAHGGNLHVESEKGKGTTFVIFLPSKSICEEKK